MKKLLLLLIIAVPYISNAQNTAQDSIPLLNFFLIDNEVVYIKIIDSELSKDGLVETLNLFLPNINDFEFKNNTSNKYQFNGAIKGSKIDTKKYGGTWGNTPIMLRYPMGANVIIQVRDNKYRVLIKGIKLIDPSDKMIISAEDFATAKKRTALKHTSTSKGILKYIDFHLTDMFTLKEGEILDDNF